MNELNQIELAAGQGVMINPETSLQLHALSQYSDIELVWSAALWSIRNRDKNRMFVNMQHPAGCGDLISWEPPESEDPEIIKIRKEYSGSWRDTYRTLTIRPDRAVSYRYQNIHFNSGDESLDGDYTVGEYDHETQEFLKSQADKLREHPDLKLENEFLKETTNSEDTGLVPVDELDDLANHQKQFWGLFDNVSTLSPSDLKSLRIISSGQFQSFADLRHDLSKNEFQTKVLKSMLAQFHPDNQITGNADLFRLVNKIYEKLKEQR